MANRRLAIASLLCSEPTTPKVERSPPPQPSPPRSPARQPPPSPPPHFSIPTALTRRTPSPPTLDDAPPMKRYRSDPEAERRHNRQLNGQRSNTPVGSQSRSSRPSYSNPGFYSTSSRPASAATSPRSPILAPRRHAHSASAGDVHLYKKRNSWDLKEPERDELQPMPLATFSHTTHTEQRWEESRSNSGSSGAHSPTIPRPDSRRSAAASPTTSTNLSALAALVVGVKGVEEARASILEERTASASLKSPPSRDDRPTSAGSSTSQPGPSHQDKQDQSSAGAVHFPSSSERDRPPSPGPSRSPSSSSSFAVPPKREAVASVPRDAHDWLLDQLSKTPPAQGPAQQAEPRNDQAHGPSARETMRLPVPDSPTVEDELLSLIDGPADGTHGKAPLRDKAVKHEVPDTILVKAGLGRIKEKNPDNVETQQLVQEKPALQEQAPSAPPSAGPLRPAVSGDPEEPDAVATSSATALSATSVSEPKTLKKGRPAPPPKKKLGVSGARPRKKLLLSTGTASRSRSTSVLPPPFGASRGSSPGHAQVSSPQLPEDDEMDVDVEMPRSTVLEKPPRWRGRNDDDDKLYCICRTPYDEDRVMIACDRCDEWYHTVCVRLSDLDLDLVDQFVCPNCSTGSTHETTYKARCHRGASGERASSPSGCWKAARLPLSKYCSDSCGMTHVAARLAAWEARGGGREPLWDAVKHARAIEGVTVPPPLKAAENSETARLRVLLGQVVQERAALLRALDFVRARERLVELSASRSDRRGVCGWDERLTLGDSEWSSWVLANGTWLLGGDSEVEEESDEDARWCPGQKKCERHSGWQKLRLAEVEVDKAVKNSILEKLTTRERDIRRCIEDLEPPALTLGAPPVSSRPRINGRGPRVGGPKRK